MWNFERVNVNRWGSISAPQMIDDRDDRVNRVDHVDCRVKVNLVAILGE